MEKNFKKIIYSLNKLEKNILPILLETKKIEQIVKKTNLSELEIKNALFMLEEKKFIIIEKLEENYIVLDKFGEKFVKEELPEFQFLNQIKNKPKKQSELEIENQIISSSIGILKKNNFILIKKEKELEFTITKDGLDFLKNYKNPLLKFLDGKLEILLTESEKKIYKEFVLRKGFLKKQKKINFEIIFEDFGYQIAKLIKEKYMNLDLIENLDYNMLKNKLWENKEFRHYNTNLKAPFFNIGRRHPMIQANNILHNIFIEMGFSEMRGPLVESAFWNMDLLWIPQDHPARDEQDTFYLEKETNVDKDLLEKVKQMHEIGINKTHTEKGDFSKQISKKRLLRTHSTATTFRTLYKLSKKYKNGQDINGKYFYVANNFRNEAIDATHLAEFFQAEGFIIGDNLSLADLMGFIKEYYKKLGITKIKFKPTFNPYTEPSMEAHYYDPKMDKWYALINSGIFREETLKPLGLEKKTIIAWGMGATRVAVLLSGKSSMREITGATCDFDYLQKRKVIRKNIVR